MVLKKDQIMKDATKKLEAFQLIRKFSSSLCCHLLNVAFCVKQTSYHSFYNYMSAITCSKSTTETPEHGVKYVQS